jgi:hypothetical protein
MATVVEMNLNNPFDGNDSEKISFPSLEALLGANTCPVCAHSPIEVSWQQVGVLSRDANLNWSCQGCSAKRKSIAALPLGAPFCWPLEDMPQVVERLQNELTAKMQQVQRVVESMPAAMFATHPNWSQAHWNATTYQWHPTSEVPPLIGLVFQNEGAGLEIFRDALISMNHIDPLDEIRISIIEGAVPSEQGRPGYSIHISPDPDAVLGRATMNDLVVDSKLIPLLGQWNRHYPIPGIPSLLNRFKHEYELHGEFMLAPVVRRADGQSYMDHRLGIVKKRVKLRQLSDITDETDIDALAHVIPLFSSAPDA